MSTDTHFDLVILGGGPAGTRAAFDAVAAGMKTALVESGFLGGACLNVGCIPTKYLLGATASLPLIAIQKKYKVATADVSINFEALQNRKERYIKGTRQALEKQLTDAGVTLFHGKGSFTGPTSLYVVKGGTTHALTFGKCLIATGSIPASFPGLRPDGAAVCSSTGLLFLKTPPKRLIIVGGGAIGLELGEIYHRLGSEIMLVEGASRILPGEDPEVSDIMSAHLRREGWSVITGRKIAALTTVGENSLLRFEDGEELIADKSLLAIGRQPETASLNLDKAGIATTGRGWIQTDGCLLCSEHVYAAGDINGRIQLAHAADHQARYVVRHASGKEGEYAPPAVPGCVYGTMELMRVGPTIAELLTENGTVSISRAPLASNAIAQSYGHTQGMARVLWKDDILRGISVVGHGASHLVSAAALLVGQTITADRQLPLIFAHPTLDEVLESAILGRRERIL